MKYIYVYLFLPILLGAASCSQKESYDKPIVLPEDILKNSNTLWNYHNSYLKLSEDYISLDTTLKPIAKKEFLRLITTGKYLPLRLTSRDTACYQLYGIGVPKEDYIPTLLYTIGTYAYKNYILEGNPLPLFDFTDIEGNKYNPETTKGKIVVLKCWFIHCPKCVEEMPLLNKMIENNKRNDLIFASLAFDKKAELKEFFKRIKFDCATISDQRDYLRKVLDIIGFPTYIIINKKGVISKVVQSFEELEFALFNEFKK